jgi:iron(III) transport system ATP-binding protein
MDELVLNAVSQAYGVRQIISDLSFQLARGDIGCLLGPSGCGKTTALRCIAGFEPVQSGEIRIAGDVVSRPGTLLAAEKRRIGMVFQDYALFAHLTVAGNVGFGLTDRHQPAGKARVDELLALVGLAAHAQKYPHQLSGGQQQRVALARALAPRPRLILMDEPFSNLDVELRERLSIEVRDILKREATTALIVTHDQNEAFSLADWVGVMHQGCIQQWDTPYNLYHQPANRFVADFVGQGAMLTGDVLSSQQVRTMDKTNLSESDICDKFIRPAMEQGGWDGMEQIFAQYPLRAGRVVVRGNKAYRDESTVLRADYALFYKPNIPLAVVEAKDNTSTPWALAWQQAIATPAARCAIQLLQQRRRFCVPRRHPGHRRAGAEPHARRIPLARRAVGRYCAWKGWSRRRKPRRRV